jgi:hypothetical protein
MPEPPAGRDAPPGPTLDWSAPSGIQSADWEAEPDPFDPARVVPRLVDLWVETNGMLGIRPIGRSYAVYPLIYSAGPDGRYEINEGKMPDGRGKMTYQAHWQAWRQAGYGDLNPFLPDLTFSPQSMSGLPDESGVYDRRYVGQPRDARGYFAVGEHVDSEPSRSLDHYDNIHNHQVEAE